MSARHASSRKVNALSPRTLKKLHRAVAATRAMIEPLEERRLLTTFSVTPISTVASEDGRYVAEYLIERPYTDTPLSVNLALAGIGPRPADVSEVTLSCNNLSADGQTLNFDQIQTQCTLRLFAADDALFEADEDLQVSFIDPADNSFLANVTATLKSDENEIWIEGGGTMSENGGTLQFTVHREDLENACTNPASVGSPTQVRRTRKRLRLPR